MGRDEAFIKYRDEIRGYLEAGKQELAGRYAQMLEGFGRQLKERIEALCRRIRKPAAYVQISLLQCLIGQDIYRIMISVHDETYFLDSDMNAAFLDVNELFDSMQSLKRKLYDTAAYYHGTVQLYEADRIIVKLAMEFFKEIGGEFRPFFRDFDRWDGVVSLPAGPKLVVKWGEHREYSETIFLMNRREKTQEEFILKNEQNSLEEWDGQYIYQGWDGTNFSDAACCRKNLMFVNMRGCRLERVTWENCLAYGAAFRQAELEDVVFTGCDLSRCDFRKARLKHVRFIQCRLDGSDFAGAQMQEADFAGSTMEDVLFTREELSLSGLDAVQLQRLRVEEEPYVFHDGRR